MIWPFKRTDRPVVNATKSTAVSDQSAIYSVSDFGRYNPDDLIGRKGFGIYKRIMRDEQVKAAIKFKRDAVTSRDYLFELDLEQSGLSEEEVDRRIRISNEYIDQMRGSWMDVLNYIMTAMYQGFSLTEMLFEQIEVDNLQFWSVGKFKLRPFDTFYFDTDEYGELKTLRQRYQGNNVKLDIRKFVHFVVNPDVDEWYGQSDLYEVYRAWFNKSNIIKFRSIWLERHAGGFTVLRPINSKSVVPNSEEHNSIKEILRNLATSAGILLPNNMEMDTHFPTNNVAFKEAIDDADTSIARAILIPNLLGVSPQGKTGSFAQSQTQFEAFLWTLEADSRRLEEAINEQIFRLLGDVNFGDRWYPRFKFKPASQSKMYELMNLWKDMVSGGAVQHTDTDEEHIRDMVDFPAAGDPITSPQPEPTNPQGPNAPTQGPGTTKEPEPEVNPEVDVEETVVGKGRLVTSAAFTKALKRVDFAVIAKTSEDLIESRSMETARLMGIMTDELLTRLEASTEGVQKIRFNSQLMAKLRASMRTSLSAGWNIGTRSAQLEVEKAKEAPFTATAQRLDLIEKDFFDIKSFAVAGKLTDDALAVIKNIILQGAKTGKTTKVMEREIYASFIRDGFITIDEAPDALGEALISDLERAKGINVNVPHRINTMLRTNTFEAINEARYAYFTDPELRGFVQAFEYSAILDSRTTQICQHLDGRVFGTGSEEWNTYRPPNHMNCRSLLIPVTEVDTWTPSEEPTIEPQRGFG